MVGLKSLMGLHRLCISWIGGIIVSSDLSVRINGTMNLHNIICNMNDILKRILSIDSIPEVSVFTLVNGKRKIFEDTVIGLVGQYLLIGFKEYEEGISITITEVPLQLPYITEDEAGIWTGISVGVKKSSIEFAIAAALAIAIAQGQGEDIIDDACIWNKSLKISPLDFFNKLSVKGTYKNIDEASNAMFEKLNLSRN